MKDKEKNIRDISRKESEYIQKKKSKCFYIHRIMKLWNWFRKAYESPWNNCQPVCISKCVKSQGNLSLMKDKEKNMYIRDISRKESEYIKKKKKK